jgi:metal-sulfur cluster biosynthetic enzyme
MTEKRKSFIEEIEDEDDDSEFHVDISNTSSYINTNEVVLILKNIYDPEISYSIYDLGLIYSINISDTQIDVVMTLTTINCPEAQSIPEQVKNTLQDGFSDVKVSVEVVFEPAWTVDNMDRNIKLNLGLL